MRRGVLIAALLAVAGAGLAQVQPVTITTTSPLPTGYTYIYQAFAFSATTIPSNQTVTWSSSAPAASGCIAGLPPGMSLDSAGNFTGTPSTAGTYCFGVTATLATGGGTTTQQFTMVVVQSQVTINTPALLPNAFLGQSYSVALSATSTAPGTISWFLNDTPTPPGLSLSTSGILSGAPTTVGSYNNVSVIAELDSTDGFVRSTQQFTVNVYAGQVVISTNSLPVAPVGQPYTAQLAGGPANGLLWSVSGLPPGINFDVELGAFSGTPPNGTAGAYPIQVQASYPNYLTATKNLTLYVTNGPLRILESNLPVAIQNQAYQTTLTPTGGLGPYSWSVGTNGAGLAIDPQKGTLSGTPKTIGPITVPVQLSDITGTTYSQAYTLFVAAPLTISTTSLPNGSVNTPYPDQTQLVAGGGQAPYTWVVVAGSGSLPPGLTLATNGLISGIPTANGVYNFTVQVTDAGKRTATKALSITIGTSSVLTISTSSLPDAAIGVAYSQTLAATGGTSPYTWAISGGTLPAGLSLNASTGTISGTPTALGSSTFTVQVTDSTPSSAPNTAQKAFTLNVSVALNITTTSLPGATVGTAYSQTIQATGGRTPYTWSIVSGALPGGLQLNSGTGAITGTPATAGSASFAILVTDTGGQSARQSYTINISGGEPSSFTIGTIPANPAQQPSVSVSVANPFPSDILVTFSLSFKPLNTGGAQDATLNPGANLVLPAGQTQVTFPNVLATGTVAGTITLTAKLVSNGVDITPNPAPTQTIVIPPAPPVITSVAFSNTNGLTVTVIGYSTTRDMTSGDFVFSAAPGSAIQNADIPVQLGTAFTQWYSTSASSPFGSQFKLTVPFNVTAGSAASVTSVSVSLTNSQGKSAAVSPQ